MDEREFLEKITLCAYKPEEEITDEERHLRAIEARRCKESFLYFFKYVKIVEPPTLDNLGGIINALLPEHLKKFTAALLTKKLIVVLKARQIYISWFLSAYDLWFVLSHIGASVMIFSKGEVEAIEKLAKCHRIYSQLPDFLRLRLNPDSATEMGFPTMMSYIKAFAATETAGISFTASVLDIDEWAEHPYADQNYLASKPTRDAGGQFIGVFTANKLRPDNLATAIFQDALAGENTFMPLFFPYDVRPERDEQWYEETRKNIPERELAKLTPELYMEQNYPRSIEEALKPTQTVAAFDLTVLDDMLAEADTKRQVKIVRDDIDPKIVNIYQDFHIGNYYVAATDASHGIGKDYAVTIIMNVRTGVIVADIMDNKIPPEELALHSVRMLGIYQNPLWFPEDNEWGRVVISIAQNLGYKRFGYSDKKKNHIGWHTDEKTRFDLWGGLMPAINNRQITIYNSAGVKQFYSLIRNINKNGRIEAASGKHDDYPMAVGIAWAEREEVDTTLWKPEPIETLTFKGHSRKWWREGARR